MRIVISILLAILGRIAGLGAVYVCGAFNGWDAKNPLELRQDSEGVYSAPIDFTKGVSFKMSTVKGTAGNGWSEFDSGLITIDSSVEAALNVWLPISASENKANQHAPAEKIVTLRVDMESMMLMFDDGGQAATPWSGTLPVMFITTEGGRPITSKETYVNATYYLDPQGVEGVEPVGSDESPLEMQIRGRGNYTWTGFDKKPYRIKLGKKTAILGMDRSKHFALLAHADDDLGFLRNTMGFALSRQVGLPWTPSQAPVEVVLNGDYIGLYFLTETVRVDPDRVNVVEQADNSEVDVDGGWLVEIDNYDTDPHVTVNENGGVQIWFTYKSPEELSVAQETYLRGQMQAVDKAVYQSDKDDMSALMALVDIEVLAKYYLVQQLMCDEESFHGSCYLNRQRGEQQRWKFGPVWDFGNSYRAGRGESPRFIFERPEFRQVWIGEIYKYEQFRAEVKRVWLDFLDRDGVESVMAAIDEFRNRIAVAAMYSEKRWPQYGNADIYSAAVRAATYLRNSVNWLKGEWGSQASADEIIADGSEYKPEYYDLTGRRVAEPARGVSIRRCGLRVDKVVK